MRISDWSSDVCSSDLGDHAVVHAPVRALDETVLVDARIGREAVDQADVGPFGRFDRADPAVMRRMHVAHLEAGALARQTARAEGRQPTLVGRSEESRVGKEVVCTGRSRWWP